MSRNFGYFNGFARYASFLPLKPDNFNFVSPTSYVFSRIPNSLRRSHIPYLFSEMFDSAGQFRMRTPAPLTACYAQLFSDHNVDRFWCPWYFRSPVKKAQAWPNRVAHEAQKTHKLTFWRRISLLAPWLAADHFRNIFENARKRTDILRPHVAVEVADSITEVSRQAAKLHVPVKWLKQRSLLSESRELQRRWRIDVLFKASYLQDTTTESTWNTKTQQTKEITECTVVLPASELAFQYKRVHAT